MISYQKYVVLSLELHLFFGRIMKEHSIFLEAGFTPKNTKLAKEADYFKEQFEKLLLDVVKLSDGLISEKVLDSGEIFTEHTFSAEEKTQHYTGISIDKKITLMECRLSCGDINDVRKDLTKCVKELNKKAKKLVNGLIKLKMKILDEMLCCKLFTVNYPLLIEHIIREANLYLSYIESLDNEEDIEKKSIKEQELFWDEIMMEHALFIRGLLDPSEYELVDTSNEFAKEYSDLIDDTKKFTKETLFSITRETLVETKKFKDFKEAGTTGIENCEIKSVILPLLADHVLREANHYIRLLKDFTDSR